MATTITFPAPDGATYIIPAVDDENWGQNVSNFLIAVPAGVPPRNGTFSLTGNLSFGASFGLISKYYTSHTNNPASTGILRLANVDTIEWRNATNTGDNTLSMNGNILQYNGAGLGLNPLTNTHIFVGNISNTPADVALSGDATLTNTGVLTIANGAITDAKVNASAAIALSKLASLPINQLAITDGSGVITTESSPSLTEISYVAGVTSSIQTQINNISGGTSPTGAITMYGGASAPSGWLLCDGSSYTTAGQPNLFAVIGYTFGGAGANFNVPNFVNNVPIGAGSTASLGTVVGSNTVTVIQNAHNHTQNAHQHVTGVGVNAPGSTAYIAHTPASGGTSWPGGSTSESVDLSEFASSNVSATPRDYLNTTNTTATNQSTTATNNSSSTLQPSLGVTYIIKA